MQTEVTCKVCPGGAQILRAALSLVLKVKVQGQMSPVVSK